MINPAFQIVDEIQINAAPGRVWTAFASLDDWPLWNSEIVAARWLDGDAWKEGSRFELRHKSLLGIEKRSIALLRMVIPEVVAVWESRAAGIQIVNSAQLRASLGGCKLTAKHSYSGLGAAPLMLMRGRQQAKLKTAMQELKEHVERGTIAPPGSA